MRAYKLESESVSNGEITVSRPFCLNHRKLEGTSYSDSQGLIWFLQISFEVRRIH